MTKESAVKLFEQNQVRSVWNDDEEQWYFSIVDVIAVLTESSVPKRYWTDLKKKLINEGSQLYENIVQLKFVAADGKKYATDCLNATHLLRFIQSVPSPNADPEIGIDRLMETYLKKRYSKEWVNQRLKSIEVRKDLTDQWEIRGVKKGQEFAILTDEITKAWSGLSVREYKNLKDLKKENLRDNLSKIKRLPNKAA